MPPIGGGVGQPGVFSAVFAQLLSAVAIPEETGHIPLCVQEIHLPKQEETEHDPAQERPMGGNFRPSSPHEDCGGKRGLCRVPQ